MTIHKNAHVWKLHNGTHVYCSTDGIGAVKEVLGALSSMDDGNYVCCILNKFDSYRVFPEFDQAKVHIEAVVALEV